MTISSWPLCLLERRGDLQLDRVADHRDAETEAEIAALDRSFGLEADGLDMGHRRGTGAGEVDVERHRAGHAVERQIAGHLRIVSIFVDDDSGRGEGSGHGGGAK